MSAFDVHNIAAVLALIATVLLLHGWMYGWVDVWSFFITLFPLTFFVVIYVYLFTKQLEEKQRAESLLKDLEIAHIQLGEYAVQIEDLMFVFNNLSDVDDRGIQSLAGLQGRGQQGAEGQDAQTAATFAAYHAAADRQRRGRRTAARPRQ